ncbi:MAG TPA: Gfo/Idh/MocA family oxidoreductase [Humisphaera sp.]|jgi:predicted dehydrogenase|nr:Gfo/Idh/MocA family oxidoreductase [Humisphaera sp.]
MSRQLRWGIVGTGNIARQFAAGVRTARRGILSAVGSRQIASAQSFAQAYQIPAAVGSYEELIARPDIDAIYLSLPNSMHRQWTIAAVRAGKHVLCEKPFALDLAESQEMFDEAQKAGRVLMEAFMYRCHPLTHAYTQAIAAGAIGQVKLIRASFCYRTTRTDGNVRFSRELGGGALMDVGCYCINFSRMIAGAEPTRINAVARLHESGVDEQVSALMEFPGGLSATFSCGMIVQADNTTSVCGTEGYVEVPVPWKPPVNDAVWILGRAVPPRQDVGANAAPALPPREVGKVDAGMELYAVEADDFAATVLDSTLPRVTREDTLGNMRVLDEIRRQIGLSFAP